MSIFYTKPNKFFLKLSSRISINLLNISLFIALLSIASCQNDISYEYPKLEGVDAAQWPFDQPYYIMLDQQLGGAWVGEVNPNDLPAKVIIDWIRLYQ